MGVLDKAYKGLCSFVDGFANSTSGSETPSQKMENKEAWYAEWDENYLDGVINNPLTRQILRKIADTYYGAQLDDIMTTATELTPHSFPMLHNVFQYCCNILGMYNQPKAYITRKIRGVNALSLEVKGNKLILISPKVATRLSPEEQSFLLGHEISHHQQGNLVCHTINGLIDKLGNISQAFGPLIIDTIEVPLKRWCRCSEFNADRGGYLCCDNMQIVERLFIKVGMNQFSSAYAEYQEIGEAHPMLHSRLEVLRSYSNKKQQTTW